ncbi:hypothetical protein [Nocardioides sp. Root190]|uniref:hypothetical protein n=1 Tax=Nocardioides sp. Root190 TaxID=1736488 RepID=UPI0012F95708|nr:hypothetical protein [Nocardioides sp. Root190]
MASSPALLLLRGGMDYDENDPDPQYLVVRRSDGSVIRSFRSPETDDAQLFKLEGTQLFRMRRLEGSRRQVEVTAALTGASLRTVDITGKGLVHSAGDWVLVTSVTGPTTAHNAVSILRADGTTTVVPGNFASPATWVGGDSTTAYVTDSEGAYAIDITTGVREQIPLPDHTKLWAVTPTALIGSLASYPNGIAATLFRALDRTTLEPTWSVDVPTTHRNRGFLTHGDGLAQMYLPDDAPAPALSNLDLRPVDLATGELLAPLARGVASFTQLAAQEIALRFDDTPGGRLSIADGDTVVPFKDLPDVHARALDIGYSKGNVAVSWQDGTTIWTTPADGSGEWSETHPDAGSELHDLDREFSFGGEVSLVDTGLGTGMLKQHQVTWPGGSRQFAARYAILSHGGKYIQRFTGGAPGTAEIVESKTGQVAVSHLTGEYGAIDGDISWRPASNGVLTGTDLVTGAVENIRLPAGCENAGIGDVRGRWAWIECVGGSRVVNLDNPTPFATPESALEVLLGNGFMVHVRSLVQGGPIYAVVTSLHNGTTRTYGPVRGKIHPPGVGVAVDDDSTARMVYIDNTSQVRRVDLEWAVNPPLSLTSLTRPTIAGTARVGVRLQASRGTWAPADGQYTYQWLADSKAISGATATTFTPGAAQLGRRITVRVTAVRAGYTRTSAVSGSTPVVRAGTITGLTRPTVSGTARTKKKLTATAGTWTPSGLAFGYQWMRDGRAVKGATGRTYLLPGSAKGHVYSVRVTARRSGYTATIQTSRASARVR